MLCMDPALAQYYQQRIYYSASSDPTLRATVDDLQTCLSKATGKIFTAIPGSQNDGQAGIHLVIGSHPQLQGKGTEASVLEGNSHKLTITAAQIKGLSCGVYTYLSRLGFRWYLPGSEWEYVPALKNITVNVTVIQQPSFRLRGFFGTGGLHAFKTLDPRGELPAKWADWRRRNRIGGDIDPGGHYWESFDLKHKAVLLQHPEYLAMIGGKRIPWSAGAKLCISNKDLVALFVKDRVDYLHEMLRSNRYAPDEQLLITVDPSDGGGHCTCGPCMRMGSVSDRVFYLANETAKAAAAVSPRAYVNLYAYNEHASPPRQALEKNVIVQIIPYAFQKVGTPEQMIALWQAKSKNLLIYDYYGVTDWHVDLPLTDNWSPAVFAARLKYLYKKNIRGASIESSYSASAGRGLYYLARLGWNIDESADNIGEEFTRQMFGSAAPAMKKFFRQLDQGFSISSGIPSLLSLLDQASSMSSAAAVQSRIRLWKAYVHYLVLHSEYAAGSTDENWGRLMRYTWQMYTTAMIHSSRIAQLYAQKKVPSAYSGYTFDRMLATASAPVPSLTQQGVEETFRKDVAGFAPVQDMVNAAAQDYHFRNNAMDKGAREMMILNLPEFEISPDAAGRFAFSARLNEAAPDAEAATLNISVKDNNGAVVYTGQEKLTVNWKQVNIGKLKAGLIYTLVLTNKPRWVWLRFTNNFYAATRSVPTYSVLGPLYQYVPSGVQEVFFSSGDKSTPIFTDAEGRKLTAGTAKDNVFKVAVPGSGKGRWIKIENTQYKFLEFITKPSQLFFHNNYSVSPR